MSELARVLLELVERGWWDDLTAEEKQLFNDWTGSAKGADLFLLLWHARGRWRPRRTSSSQTLRAIRDTERPPTEPPKGEKK